MPPRNDTKPANEYKHRKKTERKLTGNVKYESLLCLYHPIIVNVWVILILPAVSMGFPGGSAVRSLPAKSGVEGSVSSLGRSSGEGNGNPLRYFCLSSPVNRGAHGGLHSMGSQRVRHNWETKQRLCCCCLVAKLCLRLCDPVDCSTPGFPVLHHLPELAQTRAHWVGDAIQPSHPLSSASSPAFSLSQCQGLFQWVSSSHQVAKVLKLQHQSFQWILRVIYPKRESANQATMFIFKHGKVFSSPFWINCWNSF